ncbi:Mediator of RNA polymerase II transcription subunit 14 [Desmophyllum pertusum]|uniref:Mediator of RNA polymerase II transcription subunit 14 n=1 Tax=Desmophyllum pertusum TaxID=174260 RepID=A0A9X0CCF9_9CNID|nr:Mediator of RNA polymerase II transcription subunit 14 [Desmophyllum pertusum]
MDNCPLEGLSASEKGTTRHVFFEYRIQEGNATSAAGDKGGEADDSQSHFRHMCRVYSYNYKQLTLQYDPDKQSLVDIRVVGGASSILHETFRPLSAIAKLSTKPVLGIQAHRPLMALRKFVVLPQSSTHVLLNYRNNNALEVRFRAKNLVAIRDASYSIVDPSKSRAGLSSIQNLKVFLQLYVDEVAKVGGITSRHASTADDEAPPSPITMETDTPVIDAQFTSPQPMPLTASPMIPRTSPQAPSSSVNVHSPFAASPNVNSPGNIYGVGSPALLQPSPVAPQGLAQSPAGSLGLPVPSPATSHQFITPSPALGGSSPALSHNMPVASPGSWPMSPQFTGSGQATKYRSRKLLKRNQGPD